MGARLTWLKLFAAWSNAPQILLVLPDFAA
jgi:hypothetical protein